MLWPGYSAVKYIERVPDGQSAIRMLVTMGLFYPVGLHLLADSTMDELHGIGEPEYHPLAS